MKSSFDTDNETKGLGVNLIFTKLNLYSKQAKLFISYNPVAFSGVIVVVFLIVIASLANAIAPYSESEQIATRLLPPSKDFIMGTDNFGRDVYSRVILGTRISLTVGFICVPIGLLVGGILGLIAGYLGGRIDNFIMRIVDIMFGFPGLILAILIAAVLGATLLNAMIAIGIIIIPIFARTARGPVLSVIRKEYVTSAKAIGATDIHIIRRYIIPNIITPLIIQSTIAFSAAMLDEAALSFLGLGAQPPTPSWGRMLNDARQYLEIAPWMAIFPGLAIMIAVLSLNLVGDGLRDYYDPKTRFVQ